MVKESLCTEIPILSFFAGGGFLDIGFSHNGFRIVWQNEFDNQFNYLRNFAFNNLTTVSAPEEATLNSNSIEKLTSATILHDIRVNIANKVFGVIGGPPCQDFSMNGRHRGFDGERGQLTKIYLSLISELNPTFFVLENVKGLVMVEKHREKFQELLTNMRVSYCIGQRVLNALNFGIPQNRERLFVIGINKNARFVESVPEDLNDFPWLKYAKYAELNIKDTFYNKFNSCDHKFHPNELCVGSILIAPDHEDTIPNANEYFKIKNIEKIETILEGDTKRQSFKRLHRNKFSPTACYGNNEVHLHPVLNRRISVREALRIQGVPDEYILPKEFPLSVKFKMIGNGVPVPMAEGVAKSIKSYLFRKGILRDK